ncbi:terpenoid synthase [Pochonia chlamydosporia 170]|uniref:Terpenoid synthase n=1 Tax=Pochonia chlamydosporia 170 TaxID=1380566 RepID=A0A179FXA0_METCM|nr:terpenoid synthase [Pochonia chlamydosporia 170]OAQ69609.2 terpenoid synthase [Pochonia chlamydosporia 170]
MDTNQTKYPSYVNCRTAWFKHHQTDLCLQFVSDWEAVEKSMHTSSATCLVYFPSDHLGLGYSRVIESQLSQDIQAWTFFSFLSPKLSQLSINLSRFCSVQSNLSYDRRILLHHHVAWIFLMDDVTEKLPLYNLHKTAGRKYLNNLKSITMGGPVEDMMQFKGLCPMEILEAALIAQQILAEDLMPLKKRLLSPQHLEACIFTLNQFFDSEYEEGLKFCTELTSQEILKTRVITVGGLVPMLLAVGNAQADSYVASDQSLLQLSMVIALANDIIGLYKDLNAVDQQEDGSAYLNLVRVEMRERGLRSEDALRIYIGKLNYLIQSFEIFLLTCSRCRQEYYTEAFKFALNYLDYHLMGVMGNPNNRYES